MKKQVSYFIVFFLFNFTFLNAQFSVPGACGNNGFKQSGSNSTYNGNSSIQTSYTGQACGLNYVQVSHPLHQRSFGGMTPAVGLTQPAAYAVSGIPPCAIILKAFVYASGSGSGNPAFSVTIKNPLNVSNSFPATVTGTGIDKCWSYSNSWSARADVTSNISGNGTYMISGCPVSVGSYDTDGATLIIIYSDPTQPWTGSMFIADGCNSIQGGSMNNNVTGFTVCGPTTLSQHFMIIGDLQQIQATALSFNSGSSNFSYPAASQSVWDFISFTGAPFTSGQTSANYGVNNSSDCYALNVAGGYWRTACNTCPIPSGGLTVTAVVTPSCPTSSASVSSVLGGTAPYTYTWLPGGQTTQNATNLSPGTYTVNVKDATGCNTGSAVVNVTTISANTITANSASYCSGGSANLTATGASTFTWSPGTGLNTTIGANVVANPASTTIYTISSTNSLGCTSTATTQVTVNLNPTLTISTSTVCVGQPLNVNLSTNAASVQWSGPSAYSSSSASNIISGAQLSNSGSYSATVTSVAGCTASSSGLNSVLSVPVPSISSNSPVCANGNLNLNASGGVTYNWSGPNSFNSTSQSATITNVTTAASGVYTLTAFAGICSASTTANILINSLPVPTASNNGPICASQAANFTATGGTSYVWTGPSSFGSISQNPSISSSSVTNTGTYTVTVTDVNGCVSSATTAIVVNPLPNPSATGATVCIGQNFSINAAGGATYNWAGPNSFTSASASNSFSNAASNLNGAYSVTVTSAQGCNNYTVANVSVLPLPNPIISSNSPVCVNGNLNLTASGGVTYMWVGPNGFNSTLQNPTINNVTMSANGNYTLIASTGACTAQTSSSITINPLPIITTSNSGPVCETKSITLSASGGTAYAWSGPSGFNSTSQNPIITSSNINQTGVYTVIVTNSFNCVSSSTLSLVINANPIAIVTTNTVCLGSPLTLTVSGGSSYNWFGPSGFVSTSANPLIPSVTAASAGFYSVVVTSANTCTSISGSNVGYYNLPIITATNSGAACLGNAVTLSAAGGNIYSWAGPYNFVSNQAITGFTANSLSYNGTYTVTAADQNGCSGKAITQVTIFPLPNGSLSSSSNNNCVPFCTNLHLISSSANNASITNVQWYSPNGGVLNGTTVNQCFGAPGSFIYSATMTDANGCSNNGTFTINAYPKPIANFTWSPEKPLEKTGVAQFTDGSNGGTMVGWSWYFNDNTLFSNQQNPSYIFQDPGAYPIVLVVKNQYGCSDTTIKIVNVQEDYGLYIPNAFTPNDDGLNDIFEPEGYGIRDYKLYVFDRWGEMLFYSNSFKSGWDGSFNGQRCKNDVYVWKIILTNSFGKIIEKTGHVTLMK
ncbi:MAG: gliding motility-associated C-terminal domain-containing protein [Bacteroidetes bacterium]|nr:gliding motility-associated C-terminal domain-containing protein [Bacteroidota bacterium]